MMKRKFYFNMVEIALAIAIIAIGISAIMVLFPVGINASRAAMDETNFPDAIEVVSRFVRGQVLAHWKTQADANPSAPTFSAPTCFPKLNSVASSASETWVNGYGEEGKGGLQGGSGAYKYTRLGTAGEEIFAANVKIWDASDGLHAKNTGNTDSNHPLYLPDAAGNQKFAENLLYNSSPLKTVMQEFAYSAMVEITWNDTVRTFRVDVYNPYFILKP